MDDPFTGSRGDVSRRSVLKHTALATTSAAILGASSGGAVAQDGFDYDGEVQKAIMFVGHARPNSRFVISSPILDYSPNVPEIQDNVWSNYNTRVITYLNTNEQHLFWVAKEANLPEYSDQAGYVIDAEGDTAPDGTVQPEVYQMSREWTPFGDSGFVTVNFSPVGEDEEDTLLGTEDWWLDGDENGATDGTDNVTAGDGDVVDGTNLTGN